MKNDDIGLAVKRDPSSSMDLQLEKGRGKREISEKEYI
jgi:hypothetical protein